MVDTPKSRRERVQFLWGLVCKDLGLSLRSDDTTSVEVPLSVFSKNFVVFGKIVLKIHYPLNSLD